MNKTKVMISWEWQNVKQKENLHGYMRIVTISVVMLLY